MLIKMSDKFNFLSSSSISISQLKSIIFLLAFLAFSWSIVFYFSGPLILMIVALITSSLLLSLIRLISYQLAVIFFIICLVSFVVFWYASILGVDIGAQYLYFGLIATCLSFYKFKHPWFLIVSISIPISCMLALIYTNFSLFSMIILNEKMIPLIKNYAILTAVIIIVSAYYVSFMRSPESYMFTQENIYNILENSSLSKREIEISYLLAMGSSYNEISKKCFISLTTVKSHASKIFKKLNVKNRSALIKFIIRKTR